MNIYDCFMYFDEDLLLDLRLNILNKYVKKFIIAESTYLHSGKSKKLNFNINNFSKFKDKIIYIVVDKKPPNILEVSQNDKLRLKNNKILHNSVGRENFQRNSLLEGLKDANNDDLILSSDLDEIPNLEKFKYKKKISMFKQYVFFYKFNLIQENFEWIGSRACKKKDLISFQWLRNIKGRVYPAWRIDTIFSKKKYSNVDIIDKGGWHFTSIKKPEEIFYKFSNYLHHLEFEESGLNIEDMKKIIKERKIIYDHDVGQSKKKFTAQKTLKKVDNSFLPDYLSKNLEKYYEWMD